ncbi:LysR family transcriptional regulator [Nocardia huaxiensis]|uniref:LysR family transcriptional regulator n=1 Tax=Nocardia huaxiensis TaxID=2755382 RepID=UPI001E31388E|nr:LysR family transcriptional regulator [Nocardia huaxiensis]UFS99825.1 LysR family transcriptional regulator [Nocardia huaxiensis]
MPSDDLHWFITLAELERVGAAAERLHLTQPTLSRMLARLERRLGVRLFDRHGKRLTLNEFGRIYYEHVRRAQSELDTAARELADLANPALGVVRLAFQHSLGARVVPELIAGFRRGSGRVTFTLDQDAADTVTAAVLAGAADLGLVSPKPTAAGLGWRPLLRQRLALAVPADHKLAARRQVRLAEVADADFIAMHPGFGMRHVLDDLCAAADFRPRITFECSNLGTIAGLVAVGLGVSVLPAEDPVGGPQPGPALVPLADPHATREVGLIWPTTAPQSEAVRRFRDFAVDWAGSQRPDRIRAERNSALTPVVGAEIGR